MATKSSVRRRSTRTYLWIRLPIQVLVAGYVLLIAIGHSAAWSWAANIHTICPLGGVVNLYTYFTTGGYVAKLHSAVFVMLLALVLGLVLTGKSFCGWICPLGTVQELLSKVGRRLWPWAFGRVPRPVDRVLRYAKYAILIWILVQTARSARLVFEGWDPYYNLFTIWSDEIALTGYFVVGLTLVAALFAERAFCRYACPLGALNGFFNSFSLLQIKRDADTCTECGRCDEVCPVGIKVSGKSAVRDSECTRCLECVAVCPVRASTGAPLRVRGIWSRGPLARGAIPATAFVSAAVLAFATPIAVTHATGDFAITRTHVYESPADIKGSSPLEDLVENFPISEWELYNGLGIPESVGTATQIKDLAAKMDLGEGERIISPQTIRVVIAYLDASLVEFAAETGADPARLSEVVRAAGLTDVSTVRELVERGQPGSVLYVLIGIWPSGTPPGPSGTTGSDTPTTSTLSAQDAQGTGSTVDRSAASEDTGAESSAQSIRGSTTLGDIKGMLQDFAAFLAEFGIPSSEPMSAMLRDLKASYGFEMDAVRVYVEEHD